MAAMAFGSCPSAPLIAAAPPHPAKTTCLASSNSLFFAAGVEGRVGLDWARLALAPLPVRQRVRHSGSGGLGCRCMFGLGVPELVVIAGVAALAFGPKKLPEIGRSFGKTIKSFQQAAKEFETELKKDPEDSSKPSPDENPKAVSSEDKRKELETAGTNENV